MKVNTPPPSTPELVQPDAGSPQGQPERALEQDADLFKQAMGDSASASNRARVDGRFSGKPGPTGQTRAENAPPAPAGAGTGSAPARTDGKPAHDASLEREAGLFKQAMDNADKSGRHDTGPGQVKEGPAGQDPSGAMPASVPADAGEQHIKQTGTVPAPSAHGPAADDNDAESGLRKDEAGTTDTGADVQQDLQQLLAEQMMRSQTASMQRTEVSTADSISPQLVSDVAQRILVSAGTEGQGKEVRIQIKDSLLQDTEVFIAHRQGELQVTFVTQSPADSAVLARSRDAITTSLEQALDGSVKVNVEADTDSRERRSRGEYIEQEDE